MILQKDRELNKSERVRTFIALEVPEDVKRTILEIQDQLRRIPGAWISWVRSKGVHLTLQFLGDVDLSSMTSIEEVVKDCASKVTPFKLTTEEAGGFPNLRKPRVLWIGIDSPSQLLKLQRDIEHGLADLGFPAEGKKFHPHLTVGRIKSINRNCPLPDNFTKIEFSQNVWEINDVRIMSSILKPEGAEYKVIAKFKLGEQYK